MIDVDKGTRKNLLLAVPSNVQKLMLKCDDLLEGGYNEATSQLEQLKRKCSHFSTT